MLAAPTEIWCVVDDLGNICHSASWPQAAHDHINEALQEHGLDEAATWVVRSYVLAAAIREKVMGEIGLLEYFAAHAPDVPHDFERRVFNVVRETANGKYIVPEDEPECARIVRWRWHYAREMAKAKGAPNE